MLTLARILVLMVLRLSDTVHKRLLLSGCDDFCNSRLLVYLMLLLTPT